MRAQESAFPLQLRRAMAADRPAVMAMMRHLSPELPPMSEDAQVALWQEVAANPAITVWLVEEAGIPLGSYTLVIIPGLCHGGAAGSLVESVVVVPEARNRGIGELMMRHAVATATAAGCYKLALSSNQRRLDAHRFYRRLGFNAHGISFRLELSHG